MKQYANYHKHDHVSNIFVPDTHIKCEDYLKRIKELGYTSYWTTNHGSGGDIFEARDLCDKYGIKCFFGVEGYIVPNPLEKDNRNYHIIILPRTNEARKELNLATSRASIEGFYYKPRLFIEDLLKLNPDNYYLTTACVAGIIRDDDSIEKIFKPLANHFKQNLFLEVQNHLEFHQIEINKKALELAGLYNLKLVAANDSHYIYPEQSKDRLEFLKGKGINYGDEDSYILDYPDYDTFFERFKEQGVLSEDQIIEAIDNTLLFESCEEIYINRDIKMPSAYPNLTPDEKIAELKKHINKRFADIIEEEHIPSDKLSIYKEGIRYEMKTIEDTKEINTADYFLLNEKIVDLAVNKYGGVLTRTGRGSCGSFYINKILGMTQIDRFTAPITLYPDRFISTARLLENRSTPDIDYNISDQKPFLKATQEVLGENGVYPMIAYGTMQIGEAFRNVCRSHGLSFDDFNEVAKDIESYKDKDEWRDLYIEAQKYVDTIVSASVHPCAHILDNHDIRREYGVVKIGEFLCCMITSGEADAWKCLKNDYLIVSVWGIISDVFKKIGRPILRLNELLDDLDDRIWALYENGITCTLNQLDSDYATGLAKIYKPHTVAELAHFTGAIRPSFDAWRDDFLHRRPYTTGSKQLDEVLHETGGMILYQESLMAYFNWLGITPAESIGLIKKISKKKIHPEDFQKLEERLLKKWIENTGSEEGFKKTWEMIQGCMSYGYAAPHALAVSCDNLYAAWLKVHYPLEYYSVVFGYYEGDMERTNKLVKELDYFGIKLKPVEFGKASGSYQMDKEGNAIYKSIASIKFCNTEIGDKLYEIGQNKPQTFIDFLKINPCNSRQTEILITLGFFKDYGPSKTLLKTVEYYNKYQCTGKTKQFKKSDLPIEAIPYIENYATKETDAKYILEAENVAKMLYDIVADIPDDELPLKERLSAEAEYLGYIATTIPDAKGNAFVTDLEARGNNFRISLYDLGTGEGYNVKLKKKTYQTTPINVHDIITYRIGEEAPWRVETDADGKKKFYQDFDAPKEKVLQWYGKNNRWD